LKSAPALSICAMKTRSIWPKMRCGGFDLRRAFTAGHQPRLPGAGDRWLALLWLRPGEGKTSPIWRVGTEVLLDVLRGEGLRNPTRSPCSPIRRAAAS
jgi:hypothetical protein